MALTPGTKLGPYDIVARLGAGGMGEVYRARDTRLGREVALKFLPNLFARDAKRLQRLRREAQLLASLNHPHIATIYGLEEHGGVLFLAMELVKGPLLSDRIAQGPIPLHDALCSAQQIAQALEAAHERTIIHRDLKPANVKFTPDGAVKLLDFGLAKALENDRVESDISSLPTLSQAGTLPGTLLGTAAYMSPEQAKGKHTDKRADIWAFGGVLYEMLTAKQAFAGETATEMLAGVLRGEPDWSALPDETPAIIRRLLRRCLEKDAKQRLRDIGDARMEIEEALANPAGGGSGAVPSVLTAQPAWRRFLPWALTATLGAVAAVALWSPWRRTEPHAVKRFTITIPGEQLFPYGGSLVISRDGSYVVYSSTPVNGRAHLYLHHLDRDQAELIPGTEGAENPMLSPDGQWIAFRAQGKLLKVGADGGTPVTLCDAIAGGGTWGYDGMIYFTDGENQLFRLPETGGKPQLVASIPHQAGQRGLRRPYALPDGRALLLVNGGSFGNMSDAVILAFDLGKGQARELIRGGTSPHYVPTGHLVYAQRAGLVVVPFDLRRLEITGPAAAVVEDVWQGPGGTATYDVSAEGTLVFINGGDTLENRQLVWVDRKGKEQPIIGAPKHSYLDMHLSPDGRRLAVTTLDPQSPHDLWVLDEDSLGSAVLITHAKSGEEHRGPVWTPDGKSLLYGKQGQAGAQILRKAADGSGEEEVLYKDQDNQAHLVPEQCSPDARFLIFRREGGTGPTDLWKLSLAGAHEAEPLFKHILSTARAGGQISPNGQWMAYTSTETGTHEIYVTPYPSVETAKWRISTDGGYLPRWSHDGRELYYASDPGLVKLYAVDIHTSPTFEKGAVHLLAERPYSHFLGTIDFDADPSGQRFIFLKPEQSRVQPVQFHIVLNWTEELKARPHSLQK